MISQEVKQLLTERFSRDNVMTLATVWEGLPEARYINAYYEDGCFYIITYALSGKMRQIEQNPAVALAGEWFSAKGEGENLGWFGREENRAIVEKLRAAFAAWIDNGHNNYEDENTIILRVRLTSGVLFSHGKKYELDFAEK